MVLILTMCMLANQTGIYNLYKKETDFGKVANTLNTDFFFSCKKSSTNVLERLKGLFCILLASCIAQCQREHSELYFFDRLMFPYKCFPNTRRENLKPTFPSLHVQLSSYYTQTMTPDLGGFMGEELLKQYVKII